MRIAVIGLGRFGMVVARRLSAAGVEVIAIDNDRKLIEKVRDEVDLAVRLDSTDRDALLSQEIDKVDRCIVAIGEDFEAALLTAVHLLHFKGPEVICRAQTRFHAEVLEQIGVHRVVQPEREMGIHLARQLANPHLVDYIKLADGFTLIEYVAPKAFLGKSIRHLALRAQYDVNLVVIRRAFPQSDEAQPESEPKSRVFVPRPDEIIEAGDVLMVVGPDESLARLPKE